MKRPKPARNTVTIEKAKAFGELPLYISLAQRHFEKEQPTEGYRAEVLASNRVIERGSYKAPVDLVGMVLSPDYVEQIDSVELCYERTV